MGKEEKSQAIENRYDFGKPENFIKNLAEDMSHKYKKVDTEIEYVGDCFYATIKCRELKEGNDDSSTNNKKES